MLTMPTVAHDLLERMWDARRRGDALFQIVRPDSIYERPIAERHRIIFYVGHLEAFDWNLLGQCFGQRPFSPELDRLFAFGIDPVGGGLPDDRPSDWPSLDVVHDYVAQTRRALDEKLSEENLDSRTDAREGFPLSTLLNVAVEHRLMHLETLAYMLHQLPLDRKVRQVAPPDLPPSPIESRMISIPAGRTTLGLPRGSDEFGWDNEYESDTRDVSAFEIDQYKVTNRRYLDFMNAGGYESREFWSDDDWNWRTSHGVSHPVFWRQAAGNWFYRTMFDEVPLPAEWPAYVSHAEAMAYSRWAGKSLPSEEQWQHAAHGTVDGQQRRYPWGTESPSPNRGNFNFQHWNPTSVNAFPSGASAFGVHDILGNGWEWTSSLFAPLPGFKPFPFYKGYSADFFDGKHFVMKGGSARTAACMLRPTFRNWFQAHYQYVYAGFRCVSH